MYLPLCTRFYKHADHSKAVLYLCAFIYFFLSIFRIYLSYAALSVTCTIVITYWERTNLLAFLRAVFSSVFVTFPYSVWVWNGT